MDVVQWSPHKLHFAYMDFLLSVDSCPPLLAYVNQVRMQDIFAKLLSLDQFLLPCLP